MRSAFWILLSLLVLAETVPLRSQGTDAAGASPAASAGAAFKGEKIFLRDFGRDEVAYLSIPAQAPSWGLLVAPDGYGLGPRVMAFCDAAAAAGYLALAVDLTNGRQAASAEEAARLHDAVVPDVAVKALEAGLMFYEKSPRFQMQRVALITLGAADRWGERLMAGRAARRVHAWLLLDAGRELARIPARVPVRRVVARTENQDWVPYLPDVEAFLRSLPESRSWWERIVD